MAIRSWHWPICVSSTPTSGGMKAAKPARTGLSRASTSASSSFCRRMLPATDSFSRLSFPMRSGKLGLLALQLLCLKRKS